MNNIITQEEKDRIDTFCSEYRIRNYIINADGSIDVDGDVDIQSKGLLSIHLNFNTVSGDFNCAFNKLISLEGAPNNVGGDFHCGWNQITSLEGCPKVVGVDFNCRDNKLKSLKGCPIEVDDFNCVNNKLTSLVYCPVEVRGEFWCYDNPGLPSVFLESLCPRFGLTQEEQHIFLKYQSYYDVWTPEFNIDGFNELISEIKDGLR
jgi:hypothetical protein